MPVKHKYTLLTDDLDDMESLVDGIEATSFDWSNSNVNSSSTSSNRGFQSRLSTQSVAVPVHNVHSYSASIERNDGDVNNSDILVQRTRSLPKYMYREYYASIETEENIKCIVSSALFVALVLTVIVVTFVVNPQM